MISANSGIMEYAERCVESMIDVLIVLQALNVDGVLRPFNAYLKEQTMINVEMTFITAILIKMNALLPIRIILMIFRK